MDKKSIKELVIASSFYSLGSILGPLLFFGGIGLILDKIFDTKPWALLINIFVAFIITNVLLFKKVNKINGMMDAYRLESIAKEKAEADKHPEKL